jgi:uncharacterized membrane protein
MRPRIDSGMIPGRSDVPFGPGALRPMSTSPNSPDGLQRNRVLEAHAPLRALVDSLRTQIISGLVLALPIALTFWIIYELYQALNNAILGPASDLVRILLGYREGFNPNSPWVKYISPLIALVLVGSLLYMLGLFARSGLRRALDWVLLHLPGVTTIYKALSGVFQSLEAGGPGSSFQRVVLVEFPHPGSKALGFVTKTLADASNGRPILCVCVLTGVVPPAGFTLYVPEANVTDVDWSVNQALQAIISGGINTPNVIHYTQGLKVPPTGPIVDELGHPIPSSPHFDDEL